MQREKPAVIQVITHLPQGGAQRVALTLAEHLDKERFDAYLVSGEAGGWVESASARLGKRFLTARHLVQPIAPRHDALVIFELVGIFKKIQRLSNAAKLIVNTHAPKAGVAGRIAAKLVGAEIVHTLHGLPFNMAQSLSKQRLFQSLESLGYKMGGTLVSVTEANRRFAIRQGWAKPEASILIPPAVDFERFSAFLAEASDRKQTLGIPKEASVIGMVASLKPPKDPHGFLKAAASVAKQAKKPVRFVLAGGGVFEADLKALAQSLGIGELVHFLGWFDPIEALYPMLDLLALPSFSEGLPLTLIEAMGAGVPVVASDVGGVRELVEHGKNGLLVGAGDDNALATAMLRLLEDEPFRKWLISNAQGGLRRFTLRSMLEAYESLYESL